jgi:hypothetical protein
MPPILRAVGHDGASYDDPSEDLLFELLDELVRPDDFLIVERVGDLTDQSYAQVLRMESGYLIERRSGSSETHISARSADMRAVHQDLTTWAFSLDRPAALSWTAGLG